MNKKFKGLMNTWTITDDSIKYGGVFKKTIRLDEIGSIKFIRAGQPTSEGEWTLGHIRLYRSIYDEKRGYVDPVTGNPAPNDKGILISYRSEYQKDIEDVLHHIIDKSRMDDNAKVMEKVAVTNILQYGYPRSSYLESPTTHSSSTSGKNASVVGRAVVDGIVAGPAGAVVGALSAVDKNNRNK